MCLIAWDWQPDADMPLLLIANRDEFYARPTQALHAWQATPIVAGKDLQAGGTWLGLAGARRLAALTNVRDLRHQRPDAPSRGALVSGFLSSRQTAADYLAQVAQEAAQFNPFNLLVFDGDRLCGLQSQSAQVQHFAPGLGAVSNAGFGTPWPKLLMLQSGLGALQGAQRTATDALFALLAQDQSAPDHLLPDTGLPRERERLLSRAFIRSADYGTRASSIVMVRRNSAEFIERSFDAQGPTGQVQIQV